MSAPADLTMPHLRQGPPPAAAAADPREQRAYGFNFRWASPRGRVYEGRFENQILTIGDKARHGIARARMQAGYAADALSPTVVEMIFICTWLDISLTARPEWARDLYALTDETLVQEIFQEVAKHEQTFRGESPSAEDGAPGA